MAAEHGTSGRFRRQTALICAMLAAALLFPAVAFGSEAVGGESTAEAAAAGSTAASEAVAGSTAASEAATAGSEAAGDQSTAEAAVAGSTAASEAAAENSGAGESTVAEDAVAAKKDIMILFTSDVHCGFDQGFGYAGLEQVRKYVEAQGYDVILVDDGDNIQGDLLGSLTEGEVPIDLMNRMGYSVAIPGNHEFDYGMDRFLELAEKAEFPYISFLISSAGERTFLIRMSSGKPGAERSVLWV